MATTVITNYQAIASTIAAMGGAAVGAVGAKHFILTVSQEVRHPKPSIFV